MTRLTNAIVVLVLINLQDGNGTTTTARASDICNDKWSSWINTDTPNTGDGDIEVWNSNQLLRFCSIGKVNRIECQTTYGIPSYSSGEIQQCAIEGGSVCLNVNNFPIPCSDYKIRYFCDCSEVTTHKPAGIVTDMSNAIPPGVTTVEEVTTHKPAGIVTDMSNAIPPGVTTVEAYVTLATTVAPAAGGTSGGGGGGNAAVVMGPSFLLLLATGAIIKALRVL